MTDAQIRKFRSYPAEEYTYENVRKVSSAAANLTKCASLIKELYDLLADAPEAKAQFDKLKAEPAQKPASQMAKRNPSDSLNLNHTIVIESGPRPDAVHVRHNKAKYDNFVAMMSSQVSEALGQPVQVCLNEVPKAWASYECYCQLIPCNDPAIPCYGQIPRIGAFEVSYKGILIFSKLLT